jgi:hypothetical protein
VIAFGSQVRIMFSLLPSFCLTLSFCPGQSVYWQKMFQISPDPTFVLLTYIWHAVYSWDEALQDMYKHICSLVGIFDLSICLFLTNIQEAHVMSSNDIDGTQELYNIRAHQLHYASLIEDLFNTVNFILETKNPAMESSLQRRESDEMLHRECHNLMNAIKRLERERSMQDHRLKNVMNLVCYNCLVTGPVHDDLIRYSVRSTFMTASRCKT